MQLDSFTLLAAGGFVTAVSGILLLAAWTQVRTAPLLTWSAAAFANAIGIGALLVSLRTGSGAALTVADVFNVAAPVLVWTGARQFNARRVLPWVIVAGLGAALAFRFGALLTYPALAPGLFFALNVIFLAAAGWEISRQRPDDLAGRWPLAAFLFIHAAVFAGGILDVADGSFAQTFVGAPANRFWIIHLETVVYALGTTVFMVLLSKQRSEQTHIAAARHDPLTGVVNRGAFLEGAHRIIERHRQDAMPVALVMFDLDRFKAINDTFGHAVGDEAIRIFTQTAMKVLRATDLLGRYGGEEFALVLPGATPEIAYAIADRIRRNFAEAASVIDGWPVAATISGGVTVAGADDDTMDVMLRRADHYLYRAKHLGRNRIATASERRLVVPQVA